MPLPVPFRYHIDVFWSDEDECYIANIPDFRYCSAFGDSPEEAIHEIMVAAELWLDVALEQDKAIPAVSYQSASARHET